MTWHICGRSSHCTEPVWCRCRWGCILAPPGEYLWTVHVWWWCGLSSNYFDPLLLLGHIAILWPILTERVAWSVSRPVCHSCKPCDYITAVFNIAESCTIPQRNLPFVAIDWSLMAFEWRCWFGSFHSLGSSSRVYGLWKNSDNHHLLFKYESFCAFMCQYNTINEFWCIGQ